MSTAAKNRTSTMSHEPLTIVTVTHDSCAAFPVTLSSSAASTKAMPRGFWNELPERAVSLVEGADWLACYMAPHELRPGAFWMPNISEHPTDARTADYGFSAAQRATPLSFLNKRAGDPALSPILFWLTARLSRILDPLETTMTNLFLAGLIGPFPMDTQPVRDGFYVVDVAGERQMWHFDAAGHWSDSDDGLGALLNLAEAAGWYGAAQPGLQFSAESASDDGLE